jgi:hypothetical protein
MALDPVERSRVTAPPDIKYTLQREIKIEIVLGTSNESMTGIQSHEKDN